MIRINDISKSFDHKKVLANVSHTFSAGTTSAITGPSGMGKTTLINILLGLKKPDSGKIAIKSGIRYGCVFQEDRLIEHLTAMQNLMLVCRDRKAAAEALTTLGLDPENNDPVSKYSGGMRRRVAIARAVIIKPDVIILDEPFKGLDADARKSACSFILEKCFDSCRILVTHDPEELELMMITDILELSNPQ